MCYNYRIKQTNEKQEKVSNHYGKLRTGSVSCDPRATFHVFLLLLQRVVVGTEQDTRKHNVKKRKMYGLSTIFRENSFKPISVNDTAINC